MVLLLGFAAAGAVSSAAAAAACGRTGLVGQHLLLPVDQAAGQNVVLVSLDCLDAVVDDSEKANELTELSSSVEIAGVKRHQHLAYRGVGRICSGKVEGSTSSA